MVHVVHGVLGGGGGEFLTSVIGDGVYNGVLLGAALVCVARAVWTRHERMAWALIGFGLAAWSAADLY
ncbi:MAG TPA: hypothetical protein VNO82_05075 [Solirubrobacteraceae bacterium]|nr:hypothetical protein [Solirubrobacteraceae bacterium]